MINQLYGVILTLGLSLLAGCKKDSGGPVRMAGQLTVDGLQRSWLVHLPAKYAQSAGPLPLVIGLHGTGGNAGQFERDYAFSEETNYKGYIAVYPEGVRSDGPLGIRTWNAGYCCDYAARERVDDVKFIRLLLDSLQQRFRIDASRVYVAGMSNGAMMAYRLAAELPDRIAAIAAVSGTLVASNPVPAGRAIPVLHIHSALDTKIPYQGGTGLGGYYYPPVDSVLQVWASRNQCDPVPQVLADTEQYTLRQWQPCAGVVKIWSYLTRDGGHAWPGSKAARPQADKPSRAFAATPLILDFFSLFALP